MMQRRVVAGGMLEEWGMSEIKKDNNKCAKEAAEYPMNAFIAALAKSTKKDK